MLGGGGDGARADLRAAVERLLPAAWQARLRPAYRRYRRIVGPFNARRDLEDVRHLDTLLPWVLRRDSNCIDVGAHTGEVLRRCIELAPDGGGRYGLDQLTGAGTTTPSGTFVAHR